LAACTIPYLKADSPVVLSCVCKHSFVSVLNLGLKTYQNFQRKRDASLNFEECSECSVYDFCVSDRRKTG